MANYKYLQFFDARGDNLNLDYDETTDQWSGKVYMPRVATDLHENEHVFILEKVLIGSPADEVYTSPLPGNQSMPNVFCTEWEDNKNPQIFTYTVEDSNGVPFIKKYSKLEIEGQNVPYSLDQDGQKIALGALDSSAIKINVAFSSPDEGIYERVLLIKDCSYEDTKTVAKIYFYGESVGEDERFRLMLENFGRRIDQRDAFMMRNYDIKESLPDWRLINEKRKEMLMSGEEIFPYIGSYRGLINIIKFFGYQDLRIKEYWLNVDADSENYGKVRQVQVNGLLTDSNSPFIKHPMIPTTVYRKKGEFGLFYDITRATGDFDQFGVPVTENAFQFTPEEVLIKLFSLKEKLMKDYIPVGTRIVDITGEGIYFEQYRVKSWTDPLTVFPVDVSIKVDFESNTKFAYLKDLRRFRTRRFPNGLVLPEEWLETLARPYEFDQKYPPSMVPSIINAIETFYDEMRSFTFPTDDERFSFDGDEPILNNPYAVYNLNSTPVEDISKIPAGCPVILTAQIGQFTWNDLNTANWNIDLSDILQFTGVSEDSSFSPGYVQFAVANDLDPGDQVVIDQADGGTDNPLLQGQFEVVSATPTSITVNANWSDVNDPTVLGTIGLLSMHYTWDTIDFANFYEIEWEISKGGTNPYHFKFRGPIKEYYRLPHFLPFAGEYEVRMAVYDLQNNESVDIKKDYIRVLSHELEINAFTRWRKFERYTWDSTTNTWDDFGISSWHFPIEGVSRDGSALSERELNFSRYENQTLAQVLNSSTGQYEFYMNSTDPSANRFGTMRLNWDSAQMSWDEMYHQTWGMYEYNAEFLGGFKIFDPEIGDGIQINDWPVFYFVDQSPSITPLSLQDAVDQLNSSNNPGISQFDYRVYQGPGTPYIQASGKVGGPSSWYFVQAYPLAGSPASNMTVDPYTFTYPTWVSYQNILQDFISANPTVNPDMLFLDAPVQDIIDGIVDNVWYWESAGFLKTEVPTSSFPFGERRGSLPSLVGQGAFTAGDLRTFKTDFSVPVGAVIFLTHNHSEIPGKRDVRWRVRNTVTGETFLDVKNYFLVVNFTGPGKFDVECWVRDSNGNESYTIRDGFITVVNRSNKNLLDE